MPPEGQDTNSVFDLIVAGTDAPVLVVTAVADGYQAGCLVEFATQVSIEPRRFLVCLSKRNHTFEVVGGADHLAVHLLSDESLALAQLFGSETGFDIDKFEHCEWRRGPHSLPILATASAWFTGEILRRTDFGDHVGMLLAPTAAHAPNPVPPPLRYSAVADLAPGNKP
ncbi:flavin reductase family protein [Nocardia sp. NPDC004722]